MEYDEIEFRWTAGPLGDTGSWAVHGERVDGALDSGMIHIYPVSDAKGRNFAPVLAERILRMLSEDRPIAQASIQPGGIARADCPRHGMRTIDLHGPELMCEECRMIGPDDKPLKETHTHD